MYIGQSVFLNKGLSYAFVLETSLTTTTKKQTKVSYKIVNHGSWETSTCLDMPANGYLSDQKYAPTS